MAEFTEQERIIALNFAQAAMSSPEQQMMVADVFLALTQVQTDEPIILFIRTQLKGGLQLQVQQLNAGIATLEADKQIRQATMEGQIGLLNGLISKIP